MERVLVTGAGGYIGTTLIPMLLDEGYHVQGIDRFFFGRHLLPEHDHLEIVKEDTRRLRPAHFEGVDHVVDLAALSNDPSGELFPEATWEINHESRVRTAKMARDAGVKRYIFPSSCSTYGFQDRDAFCSEDSPTNPLTTYAKANLKAEQDVLPLAGDDFCVVVLRQATGYGYSPRMRFDLAINGMTYGAWKNGKLPLMRDGSQWRPMVHVKDAAHALILMLKADPDEVSGEVFNVGSNGGNYQIGKLGEIVANILPNHVEIEWYGDPDHRSYRVSFDKIEQLGYKAQHAAEDGVREICKALESGRVDKTAETITIEWYKSLVQWHKIIKEVELYGEILEI